MIAPLFASIALLSTIAFAEGPPQREVPVGVAHVDITPDGPIRLTGYGNRRTESEGVTQRLRAKALAIGGDEGQGPAVLITVDNLGVPETIVAEVARRLGASSGMPRERLAVSSSHTHGGPALNNAAVFIFAEDPTPDQQGRIDHYTDVLTDRFTEVARAALDDRRPALLSWGVGEVGFAANRRVLRAEQQVDFGVAPAGSVDHSLPVLRVADLDGTTRAVLATYACHCTTLDGDYNRLHGDWAGFAQEAIERDHPEAVALISIGCGADANPNPRGTLELARQYGEAIARGVAEVLNGPLTPIGDVTEARLTRVDLPYAPLPSRAEWEAEADQATAVGRRARAMLALLDAGEPLPEALQGYPIQVWAFGDDLAMIFLAGEVVVDYAIRLRTLADPDRLWINAYSNDVPCYIASDRLLGEGGYEVDGSMIYYGRPNRFAPGVEDRIIDAARSIIPARFLEATSD